MTALDGLLALLPRQMLLAQLQPTKEKQDLKIEDYNPEIEEAPVRTIDAVQEQQNVPLDKDPQAAQDLEIIPIRLPKRLTYATSVEEEGTSRLNALHQILCVKINLEPKIAAEAEAVTREDHQTRLATTRRKLFRLRARRKETA